jgi:hypothetical protein
MGGGGGGVSGRAVLLLHHSTTTTTQLFVHGILCTWQMYLSIYDVLHQHTLILLCAYLHGKDLSYM